MNGPLGLAKQRCMASLVWASGSEISRERRELALSIARQVCEQAQGQVPLQVHAGVTSPHSRVVVMRTLSPLVEPAQTLLRQVWANWRKALWQMGDQVPRIWSM
jgi:urease accessory protein